MFPLPNRSPGSDPGLTPGCALRGTSGRGLGAPAAGRSGTPGYTRRVERAIVGYHLDDRDDWVAELACGHGQHVRHKPPLQFRPWVLDAEGRAARLGTPLDCVRCDRTELPGDARLARSSVEWDETTIPPELLRAHRLPAGTWGRLTVREGSLRFTARLEPELAVEIPAGRCQAIPPEVEHEVLPLGPVRFSLDFLTVDREPGGLGEADVDRFDTEDGGESACLLHLLCEECGAVLDGGCHRPGCTAAHPTRAGA